MGKEKERYAKFNPGRGGAKTRRCWGVSYLLQRRERNHQWVVSFSLWAMGISYVRGLLIELVGQFKKSSSLAESYHCLIPWCCESCNIIVLCCYDIAVLDTHQSFCLLQRINGKLQLLQAWQQKFCLYLARFCYPLFALLFGEAEKANWKHFSSKHEVLLQYLCLAPRGLISLQTAFACIWRGSCCSKVRPTCLHTQ